MYLLLVWAKVKRGGWHKAVRRATARAKLRGLEGHGFKSQLGQIIFFHHEISFTCCIHVTYGLFYLIESFVRFFIHNKIRPLGQVKNLLKTLNVQILSMVDKKALQSRGSSLKLRSNE